MLIDTHCHINMMIKRTESKEFTAEECQKAQEIIEKAEFAGVSILMSIGTDVASSYESIQLANLYPRVFAAVGIHPNDTTRDWQIDRRHIKQLIMQDERGVIVAVGECGIDKHYPGYNLERQKDAFKSQIELALEFNKALVVHTRDAPDETLECLAAFKGEDLRGTIHCFSEDLSFARAAQELGFVLGIGGTVTYPKNHTLRNVIQTVGLDALVLETDSPFLPPQAIRGQENSPAQIRTIALYLGELLGSSLEEVAQKTTNNACRIFGLGTG